MTTEMFLLATLDGLSAAALLFLVALGLTLIFGVMGILNVAHGSLYAIGGYMAATLGLAIHKFGLSPALYLPALFLAAVLVGPPLGIVFEIGLLRRILGKDHVLQLLVTFAAFMILEDVQRLVWGTQPYFVSDVMNQFGNTEVLGIAYTNYQMILLPVVAAMAYYGLRYFLTKTWLGREVIAMTFHREVATAMGVNANLVSLLTFVIGASLGTLGGALASPSTALVPGVGADMIVQSFAVIAIAGLGQLGGTALAACLIGLSRSFAVYLMPELAVLTPYLIMMLVLLIRPQGLFAATSVRRV
jgi:branched-chain amino acid transport system permease protein